MGSILDIIIQQANNEAVSTVASGPWFDALVNSLTTNVVKVSDPTLKGLVVQSIDVLVQHRSDIMSLGAFTLTLFLQQLASGDTEQAVLTYIKNQADPQDLINGMNAGADGIIAAKKQLDAMEVTALAILEKITVSGAQVLLPFLISLI